MRWDDVYVNGLGVALGRRLTTADAVAEGLYDAKSNEDDGYLATRVADGGPAVDFAVDAAGIALDRSGLERDSCALVLHATCAHQGLDHFASASYVQSHTVGGDATAVEIRQFSNGCLAGLDLAASTLTARAGQRCALVTTSDIFGPPAYDRFGSDKGVVFGDGGTALVVSRRPGPLRLLSTSLLGDSSFIRMQIGDADWTAASGLGPWPVDLGARRAQNVRRQGVELLMELMVAGADRQKAVIELALADAEVKVDEVAWWVMPNMGRAIVDWEFRRSLGVRESQTTWSWGREVGHLGAGDQFAGLAHLLETGTVQVGDRVVTTGIGQGENYGCAVVEVLEVPQWSTTAS